MKINNFISNIAVIGWASMIYASVAMLIVPRQKYVFLIFVLVLLGYLLQAALSKLFGISKNPNSHSYELVGKWLFSSVPTLILAAAISALGVYFLKNDAIVQTLGLDLPKVLHPTRSIVYFILISGALILGVYLCNYESVSFGKTLWAIISAEVFFVFMIAAAILYGINLSTYLGMAVTMFVSLLYILMHSSSIELQSTRTRILDDTESKNGNHLTIVCFVVFLFLLAAASFFCMLIINGILTLLGFTIGTMFDMVSLVVLLLLLGVICILIILSKSRTAELVGSIFRGIFDYIEAIFDFLSKMFVFEKRRVWHPYTETVVKLQDAEISEYRAAKVKIRSYTDFLYMLGGLESTDAKIGYAYRTLCDLYAKNGTKIIRSDTPYEVRCKTCSIDEATAERTRYIIERVNFMSDDLGENDKKTMLREICEIVRKYF